MKAAEAEAQSKALQGKGIADQRKAIVNGLRESVADFQEGVPGTTAQDVMNLVLMTQYFDTLKEIGSASKSNTILLPHSPGALTDIAGQLREAIIGASQFPRPREERTARRNTERFLARHPGTVRAPYLRSFRMPALSILEAPG